MQEKRLGIPDSPGAAFYRTLVDGCVRGVAAALGDGEAEAMLLIGAPTRGEPTVVDAASGPYSLSDVDLACVVRDGADLSAARARARRWVVEANNELASACAGVDVNVRRRSELSRLRPLISTFEMLRSPTVVWGDPSVLDGVPGIPIEDIPAWDSLRLAHNRLVEGALLHRRLSRPPGDLRDALSTLYAVGKLTLDAVTAFLFLERDVPERYADRVRVFGERICRLPDAHPVRSEGARRLPDLEALARFKATGETAALARSLGVDEDAPGLAAAARTRLREHTGLVHALWQFALARVAGTDRAGPDLRTAAALYSKLETLPRKAGRTLRMLRSPAGRAGLFSIPRAAALAPVASPRELTYLTAVAVYLRMGGGSPDSEVWPLVRRYCPLALPRGFWQMETAERQDVLLDRLDTFLRSVLHGRELPPDA